MFRNARAERNALEQRNRIRGKVHVARLSSGTASGTSEARQGRGAFGFPSPLKGEGKPERQQPRPGESLTDAERQRIASNVAEVKRLMPELVPEIKALHEAGLIDGWRAVRQVGAELVPEPTAITLDRLCLVSKNRRAEEERRFHGR